MFDRLHAAIRTYEQFPRSDSGKVAVGVREQHAEWIKLQVCPIIAELFRRADFRQAAIASVDALSPGLANPARKLISAVESGLIKSAKRLVQLARDARPELASATSSRGQMQWCASRRNNFGPAGNGVDAEIWLSRAQYIAGRPWSDLVSVYDYFGNTSGFNLKDDGRPLDPVENVPEPGEFLPFLRRNLDLPGDFIFRCICIRIQHWRRQLNLLRNQFPDAISPDPKYRGQLRESVRDIDEPFRQLEQVWLHDPKAPLRKAAVVLVQIYAAYRPVPAEFGWLGPASKVVTNAETLKHFIDERGDIEIVDAIAAALVEVQSLYKSEEDVDLAISTNAKQFLLLLVEGAGSRRLFWRNKEVQSNWGTYNRAWNFLMGIAQAAKAGRGIDSRPEFGSSLANAKNDLKRLKLVPNELFQLISSPEKTYLLNLPSDQVHVLRFEQTEHLC